MNTAVVQIESTICVVSKFDNSDDSKSFTADELENYVAGIISNYDLETDEEEALLALMQGFKAAAMTLEYTEIPVCSS